MPTYNKRLWSTCNWGGAVPDIYCACDALPKKSCNVSARLLPRACSHPAQSGKDPGACLHLRSGKSNSEPLVSYCHEPSLHLLGVSRGIASRVMVGMTAITHGLGNEKIYYGLFPLTVTVTTRGHRNYNSPLIRPPLRTVTGWGNDPRHILGGPS